MSSDNGFASVSNGSKFVLSFVHNPCFAKTDASSICALLQAYDQYATKGKKSTKLLLTKNLVSTNFSRPLNPKFCINAEWIKPLFDLQFLDDSLTYDDLSDGRLRKGLDRKAVEAKEMTTLDALDDTFAKESRTNMAKSNAQSWIKNSFA